MTGSALPHLGDASEFRSRLESVMLGARLTVVTALAGVAYALATWAHPGRSILVSLFAAGVVLGAAPLAIGPARMLHSPRRDRLMLAWAASTVGLVGGLAAADGGAHSPLAALFFLPLAFVALSFPLVSVLLIGAGDVLTFLTVGLAEGEASKAYLGFYATCLAITAVMCARVAHNNHRRQGALERVSRADPLTGCLNRRGFEERLDAELAAGKRTGGRAGLVLIDLDDFKAVNDTSGHAAGDELLRWTVERTGSVLRPMDSLGRLGGDEFAVLVPGAGSGQAHEVAGRVSAGLAERVSVSTGVASFPAEGTDRDALFRRADDELYSAKHGRAHTPATDRRFVRQAEVHQSGG